MSQIKNILVTGGAGFIGSHLVDSLLATGYRVRVLDNLDRQIHPTGRLPGYFNPKAEFILGDVTRMADWINALKNIDAVVHFASAVGVGQSMYQIEKYVRVNSLGTALLLDYLANNSHSLKKILVAASMSSYGEGLYKCDNCGLVRPGLRDEKTLKSGDFNNYCPNCSSVISPVPTPETANQESNSIYAITKKNQEEMVLTFGKAYRLPAIAMRFFNVYGPRQSLSNPYNGVAAIFLSRIKNNVPPVINEDGTMTRDFVHVYDVASACIAGLERSTGDYHSFNVGTGKPVSISDVAILLAKLLNSGIVPEITGKVRKLDVRHCYADLAKIKKLLGWTPKMTLRQGFKELIDWGKDEIAVDKVDYALAELDKRGLR